jgi:hypothetical protein
VSAGKRPATDARVTSIPDLPLKIGDEGVEVVKYPKSQAKKVYRLTKYGEVEFWVCEDGVYIYYAPVGVYYRFEHRDRNRAWGIARMMAERERVILHYLGG